MFIAQAVMLAQKQEHTHYILFKIVLAGPHDLLSLANKLATLIDTIYATKSSKLFRIFLRQSGYSYCSEGTRSLLPYIPFLEMEDSISDFFIFNFKTTPFT